MAEVWARAVLDAERLDLALSVLPSLTSQHPTNEALHLGLMEALARAQRTDDALRVGHQLRVALADSSGLEPSEALATLEQRLLSDPQPSVASTPTTPGVPLPPPNSFIGRDRELQQVSSAVDSPGVVEIVGPAGIGKTRLILEHLRDASSTRPVRFVDLARISQPERLLPAAAGALGMMAAQSPGELADGLDAGSILVFDNCEHLAPEAGWVVGEIMRRRHDVTIVCTSRTRLRTDSRCLPLSPLPASDASRLFLDRTHQHRLDFDPTTVGRAELTTVIDVTDGLPLAIELLSGRERVLGLDALATQVASGPIADRAEALLPELVIQLDRSYAAISPSAQSLLCRLSVLPAPFELGLVERLSDHPVGTLAELIDASLVAVDHRPDVRYRLLESVRAVGMSHLEPSERQAAQTAVAAWAVERVAEWRRDQDARVHGPTAGLREHAAVVDAAVSWLLDAERHDDAGRLAVQIALLVTDDPSADWLHRLRSLAPPLPSGVDGQASALFALGAAIAAWVGGDVADCERLLGVARSGLCADHDLFWCVDFVSCLAAVYRDEPTVAERHAMVLHGDRLAPDFARVTAICAAALAHAYRDNHADASRLMTVDTVLLDRVGGRDGFVDFTRAELSGQDPTAALALLERAELACDAAGHAFNHRIAAIARLGLLIRSGDTDTVRDLAPDLLADCCRAGMWPQAWIVARLCAELLADHGQHLESAALLDAAQGDPAAPALAGRDLDRVRDLRRRCHDALGDEQWRQITQRVGHLERSDLPALVGTALRSSA